MAVRERQATTGTATKKTTTGLGATGKTPGAQATRERTPTSPRATGETIGARAATKRKPPGPRARENTTGASAATSTPSRARGPRGRQRNARAHEKDGGGATKAAAERIGGGNATHENDDIAGAAGGVVAARVGWRNEGARSQAPRERKLRSREERRAGEVGGGPRRRLAGCVEGRGRGRARDPVRVIPGPVPLPDRGRWTLTRSLRG